MKLNKVFLATSFSGKVNYETGLVFPEFKKEIETVLFGLREVGKFSVFCAAEHEGWKISDEDPAVGVKKDLEEIRKADILLALLHGSVSAGVQYEMGYANASGLEVVIATKAGLQEDDLAYFNQGLKNAGDITHIEYESPAEIGKLVRNFANNATLV